MSCECARCRLFSKVLIHREDPAAPVPGESWLVEHREDWPWWVLATLLALMGLLLLPTAASVPVLLTGVLVAAVPWARQQVQGCARVPSR